MIVRILGEGQWRLPDDALEEINQLDAALEGALDGDEAGFRTALTALLDRVRTAGAHLADEELEESDVVLPHSEATPADVRDLLTDEGLIPG